MKLLVVEHKTQMVHTEKILRSNNTNFWKATEKLFVFSNH
jgi:hypothetical protein